MTDQGKKKFAVAILVAMIPVAMSGIAAVAVGANVPEVVHVWAPVLLLFMGGILAALPKVQKDVAAEKTVIDPNPPAGDVPVKVTPVEVPVVKP